MARPARDREYFDRLSGRAGSPQDRIVSGLRNGLLLRFSLVEILHLLVGTGLVTAVGLSFVKYQLSLDFLAVFVSAFLVHELGHKFLAQMYRAWAEFRIILFGAAFTAFSALPFIPIKFIAPGAVFIGPLSRSRHSRVALIGPLTNLAMGAGFVAAYYLSSALNAETIRILAIGAWFNGLIAVFNLIPFFGLDGSKIFEWNKLAWVMSLAAAIGLYVVADMLTGGVVLRLLGRIF